VSRRAVAAYHPATGGGGEYSTNLAMPQGPVNGFAQAADFYDSVGINHHPEYLGDSVLDTALAYIQELGLRHVRLGTFSPANHGDQGFQYKSGNFGIKIRNANAARAAGVQPISVLWGTTEEPRYEQNRGSAVYTITNADGTFLRPLDGPSGAVNATWGPSPLDGAANTLLQNAGWYYDQGWITAGGLQGPNEPDNNRQTFWTGAGGMRATLRGLKDAKEARTSETVIANASYIDSTTGRITAGPAHAPQIPVVGPHLVGNNWANMGSYTDGTDINCGNRHTYWGGHGPNFTELQGQWAGSTSYTGLPRFCTESGYQNRPGFDAGPGSERYTPADVTGEYIIRTLVHNYLQNVRRTFVYKLCDESAGLYPPWNYGISDVNFTRRAPFYAIKNFMSLIGFREASSPTPITVTVSGFTAGATQTLSDGYQMPDRLDKIVLQTSSTEYLVILVRQREIWDRGLQQYITVSDPKTITLTLPATTTAAAVAEPAKNTIDSPSDGQTYANPTNGTAYSALTLTGNQVSLVMAGLTRVVKVTVS
jgi:hypothetical protein